MVPKSHDKCPYDSHALGDWRLRCHVKVEADVEDVQSQPQSAWSPHKLEESKKGSPPELQQKRAPAHSFWTSGLHSWDRI